MADKASQNPRVNKLIELEVSGRIKPEHQQELDTYRAQGFAPKKGDGNGGNPTEGERKAASFLTRALGSNRSYEETGVGPRNIIGQSFKDTFPNASNYIASGERQVADSAQDEFIAASLRQDSGAAIPEQEMERQRRIYFPIPGDGPDVLKQKKEARLRAIDGLYQSAGRSITPEQRAMIDKMKADMTTAVTGEQKPESNADEGPSKPSPSEIKFKDEMPATLIDRLPEDKQAQINAFAKTAKTPEALLAYYQGVTGHPMTNPDEAAKIIDYYQKGGKEDIVFDYTGAEEAAKKAAFDKLKAEGVRGEGGIGESADAALRGAADTASLGFADEASALGDTVMRGGTYQENLDRQRAIDLYDQENSPWLRGAGQLAGAVAPVGAGRIGMNAKTIREMALGGAALGAGYGVGSGEDLGGRVAGGITGGVAGGALGAGTGVAFSKLSKLWGGKVPPSGGAPTGQDVREAADRIGVQVMPADVGGIGTRMAQGVVGRTFGEIPLQAGKEASLATTDTARNAIASTAGRVEDRVGGGIAAQEGGLKAIDAMKGRERALHNAIPIKPDMPAALTNTRQALGEMTSGLSSNPQLSAMTQNKTLQAYADALENGGLSWQDMKAFRSYVGDMRGDPALSEGIAKSQLSNLYRSLTSDMEETAKAAGPKAYDQWKKAVRYSRGMHDRIDNVLSAVLGKRSEKGENAAFRQVENWMKDKTGDPVKVGRLMRSLPPEEAGTVRATIIAHMGEPTAGGTAAGFSPDVFLTNWRSMSERAKSSVFNDKGLRSALDDLATVSQGMKASSRYENRSNTGLIANSAIGASAFFVEPVTTALVAAGSYGAGKLLSSQAMVRLLTKAASANSPSAFKSALAAAASRAYRDPALAEPFKQFQMSVLSAVNDNAAKVGSAVASPDQGPQQ